MTTVPYGYCQCGCGEKTRIAHQSHTKMGWVKGEPLRFINGHNSRGKNSQYWKGGKTSVNGYVVVYNPDHPRSHDNHVLEHILVLEKALGHPLPEGAVVHHRDENRKNNALDNLVICPDQAHHALLHLRKRAYDACGHETWRKCYLCGVWDDPVNLSISYSNVYHKTCMRDYYRVRRQQNAAQSL